MPISFPSGERSTDLHFPPTRSSISLTTSSHPRGPIHRLSNSGLVIASNAIRRGASKIRFRTTSRSLFIVTCRVPVFLMTFSSFAQAALPPGHSLSAVPAGRPASQSCPPRIPGIAPATRWLPPVSPPEYVAACAAHPALRRSTPRARELSGAWKPPAGSCGTASPVRSPTPPPRRVAAKSRGGSNPQAPQTSHPFGSKLAFHNLSVVEQLSYIERIPLCQLFSWASVTARLTSRTTVPSREMVTSATKQSGRFRFDEYTVLSEGRPIRRSAFSRERVIPRAEVSQDQPTARVAPEST